MLNMFSPRAVFRYAVMPEIGSRAHGLFASGFGYIPFFIAVVYQMVGLLPKNHPYILQRNIGRFGIRHVVAEAASNVTFSLKHIDQIILFAAILAGLAIFVIQFVALLFILIFQPVMAAPPLPGNWLGFFTVASPSQDLAYMMLDMVFGVPLGSTTDYPGFFESCISTTVLCEDNFGQPTNSADSALQDIAAVAGISATDAAQFSPLSSNAYGVFPFPVHIGLHRLFAIYSNGLLVIAVGITSYFIVTILAETAQSGTPFGKRFNKTWAPIRIVIAFGLLMPLSVGLNASQYFVLYAAKYGSAFATNGWQYFNDTLLVSYQQGVGGGQDLVSVPNIPELRELSNFLFVARTCKGVYEFYKREEKRNVEEDENAVLTNDEQVHLYLVQAHKNAPYALRIDSGINYANLVAFLEPPAGGTQVNNAVLRFGVEGEEFEGIHGEVSPICGEIGLVLNDPQIQAEDDFFPGDHEAPLSIDFVQDVYDNMQAFMNDRVAAAVAAQNLYGGWASNEGPLQSKGWAAAGIWYNKISQLNGVTVASAYGAPTIKKHPLIMERVSELRATHNETVSLEDRFSPYVIGVGGISALLPDEYGLNMAIALNQAYTQWNAASGSDVAEASGNPGLSIITMILGVDGLYSMRKNPSTHPLAMLSGIGRGLVEGSIRSLGYAAIAVGLGKAACAYTYRR